MDINFTFSESDMSAAVGFSASSTTTTDVDFSIDPGTGGLYYTKLQTDALLLTKVDKIEGKGLSTNDFDDTYKALLTAALQPGDNVSELTNDAGYLTATALTPYRTSAAQDVIDLGLRTDITDIQAKIPNQATSSNQLADKDFVNSSIATNTAHYISNNGQPFNSVAELLAYSGTVTNNDYAFVTGTDEAGNTYYDRYKATVATGVLTWAKEYRLNNSSFTANQWASINSGVTSGLVADIQLNTAARHTHSNKEILDAITSTPALDIRDKNHSLIDSSTHIATIPTAYGVSGNTKIGLVNDGFPQIYQIYFQDGQPTAGVITDSNFDSTNNYAFVSKGTLSNVLNGRSVRFDTTQSLTDTQKTTARTNIGAINSTIAYEEYWPVRGQLIKMSLGNSYTGCLGLQDTYRVLHINGSVAEVMSMYSTPKISGAGTQYYENGRVDVYLNSTWYSTLSDTAKAAIIDNVIQEDSWYVRDNSGDPIYTCYYGHQASDRYQYYTSFGSATYGNAITRHVYVISVQDIIDYMTDSSLGYSEVNKEAMWAMFWNTTAYPGYEDDFWTRSYDLHWSTPSQQSYDGAGIHGYSALINSFSRCNAFRARPTFKIDLSLIDWS